MEDDIQETALKEVTKGLASITSGYLALRIRQIEEEAKQREAEIVARFEREIVSLRLRLDKASEKFSELQSMVKTPESD